MDEERAMNRLDVVNAAAYKLGARNYLEIGVKKGKVFLNVQVRKKLAVDPVLKVTTKGKLKSWLKYPYNIFNEYYGLTSDDFFKFHRDRLLRLGGLDVVFIDGLHTYEQTWKDVLNSLEYLRPKGVIVMHDCNPGSASQATPAASREEASHMCAAPGAENWSGDVWKTIVRLRAEREDLHIGVVDCDHGVGVIARGRSDGSLKLSVREIETMEYAQLEKNRKAFLALVDPREIGTLLGS
jgi:Methyltransferase domain